MEFRQQTGTIDPDTVINWIKFVVKLVEMAVNAETGALDELQLFVEAEEFGESLDIVQLMRR
jgi:hypothetical protein